MVNAGALRSFVAWVVVLAVLGAATIWLAGNALTRHGDVPENSALEVTLDVRTRGSTDSDEEELAEALVRICHVEVRAALVTGSFRPVGPSRYRFRLEPSLDRADLRQLRGCLADVRIDHLLASVVSTEELLL